MNQQLKVRSIIATKDGYSHVVIDRASFDAVTGFRPKLPYTTGRNAAGQGIRMFNIDGTTLFARLDKETGKSVFVMSEAEARARLLPLDEERANEPAMAFAF